MSKVEKIKRVILIALGFGFATYLLINGFALLDQEKQAQVKEQSHEQNNSQ